MPKPSLEKAPCAICGEYNSDRRVRDRQGILHTLCGRCIPKWMENQRMAPSAVPQGPDIKE